MERKAERRRRKAPSSPSLFFLPGPLQLLHLLIIPSPSNEIPDAVSAVAENGI